MKLATGEFTTTIHKSRGVEQLRTSPFHNNEYGPGGCEQRMAATEHGTVPLSILVLHCRRIERTFSALQIAGVSEVTQNATRPVANVDVLDII
jgi:hypothetical protein